jgi:hypothetical protein
MDEMRKFAVKVAFFSASFYFGMYLGKRRTDYLNKQKKFTEESQRKNIRKTARKLKRKIHSQDNSALQEPII